MNQILSTGAHILIEASKLIALFVAYFGMAESMHALNNKAVLSNNIHIILCLLKLYGLGVLLLFLLT